MKSVQYSGLTARPHFYPPVSILGTDAFSDAFFLDAFFLFDHARTKIKGCVSRRLNRRFGRSLTLRICAPILRSFGSRATRSNGHKSRAWLSNERWNEGKQWELEFPAASTEVSTWHSG